MNINYNENRLGHCGNGWDAETIEEAIQCITEDKKELIDEIKAHVKGLDKNGTQVINYSVSIEISN